MRARLALAIALVAILATASTASAGARAPGPTGPVVLPRDHAPHPGNGVEWWYTTGLVRDADGNRYAVLWVLFSAPNGAVAVSQVVDLDRDRIVHHAEQPTFDELDPGPLDARVGDHAIRYEERGPHGRWHVETRGEDGLDLTLVPRKPYALHGDGGIVEQSDGGPSAYYSSTRMRSGGTLTIDGRAREVRGGAWLDHQWGSFETDPDALRWDWFSCRFGDGTELMLYVFVDEDGTPIARYRAGTVVDARGRARPVRAFAVEQVGPSITPPGAEAAYGFRWRIAVPSLGIRIRLDPLARSQYVSNRFVASFWEGAAAVRGSHRGVCFVESSREAGEIAERIARTGASLRIVGRR